MVKVGLGPPFKIQHGHLDEPCLQGVRHNGRKKKFFEFCQTFWWM
jgi:hypothetical protein